MKIGIIGATGKAGSLILKEAVERGHDVTAIVRDASKLTNKSVNVIEKNILDLTTEDVKQFDVVVNAFGAPLGEEQAHVDAGHALIEALKGTDTRAIIVGGAGSLYVDENKTMKVIEMQMPIILINYNIIQYLKILRKQDNVPVPLSLFV